MINKLIITNSTFLLNKEIDLIKNGISMLDFNYFNVREKLEVADFKNKLVTLPLLDNFKLIVFDISLYTTKELKDLISVVKKNSDINNVIAFYFLKDKLDKLDAPKKTLFKKNNFEILEMAKVDKKLTLQLLDSHNLNLDYKLFENHEDMDSVLNDILKISCLDKKDLNNENAKEYLSDSLDSNIFELIDLILRKEVTASLLKLKILLSKESEYLINLLILKHFILLRLIKRGLSLEEVVKREKFSSGKGYLNSYRFSILKRSVCKINLDFAIKELLENEKVKNFNLENSLIKIYSK